MLNKLFVHISNYSLSGAAVTLGGLISFPVFTRILTPDEYGLLSLIGVSLTFLVAIGKLGMQHSALRFYSQAKGCIGEYGLSHYYPTVIIGMTCTGLVVTLMWLVGSGLVPTTFWNDDRLPLLFMITSPLILLRVLDSTFTNILKAQERSGVVSIYVVLKRYGSIALILLTLFFIQKDLIGLYYATLFSELTLLIALAFFVLGGLETKFGGFSSPLFKSMLWFGVPMIGYETAATMLNIGDRYIIQYFVGPELLGAYSAAYNLCEYVEGIVIASLASGALPMYLRLWEEDGMQATRNFIQQSLHYYFAIGFPIVAGLCAVGSDLLVFLASEKYISGSKIIPYVISGMIINGATMLFGAGLFIRKQSLRIMGLVGIAALVNIVMNIVLVPLYGIEGAAIATLASLVGLTILTSVAASSSLRISIPWFSAVKFSMLSLGMYLVLDQIEINDQLISLIMKIVIGVILYAAMVTLFDPEARKLARGAITRLKQVATREPGHASERS